jgi:hypothetical protein
MKWVIDGLTKVKEIGGRRADRQRGISTHGYEYSSLLLLFVVAGHIKQGMFLINALGGQVPSDVHGEPIGLVSITCPTFKILCLYVQICTLPGVSRGEYYRNRPKFS